MEVFEISRIFTFRTQNGTEIVRDIGPTFMFSTGFPDLDEKLGLRNYSSNTRDLYIKLEGAVSLIIVTNTNINIDGRSIPIDDMAVSTIENYELINTMADVCEYEDEDLLIQFLGVVHNCNAGVRQVSINVDSKRINILINLRIAVHQIRDDVITRDFFIRRCVHILNSLEVFTIRTIGSNDIVERGIKHILGDHDRSSIIYIY